jgi:hypothetical protein
MRTGVTPLRMDTVACKPAPLDRDWLTVPELNLERQPAPLFQPTAPNASLRPVLPTPTLTQTSSDEISWLFGKTATVEGNARFPRDANLAAVEFEIPAVVSNIEVSATEMAGWSRQGSRVRVWFRSTPREPVVKWTGQWAYEPGLFDLPMPPRAAPWRIIRLKAAEGFSLTFSSTRGWQPAITMKPRESVWIAPAVPAPFKLSVARESVK